jgi:hypothetical protein
VLEGNFLAVIAQQVDRVQRKLNHWDVMAQSVWDKKQENNLRRKELLQTSTIKVDKAHTLHRTAVKGISKLLSEKRTMWSTRRDTHNEHCRKDERERLALARQFTIKFGDQLIEQRQ